MLMLLLQRGGRGEREGPACCCCSWGVLLVLLWVHLCVNGEGEGRMVDQSSFFLLLPSQPPSLPACLVVTKMTGWTDRDARDTHGWRQEAPSHPLFSLPSLSSGYPDFVHRLADASVVPVWMWVWMWVCFPLSFVP